MGITPSNYLGVIFRTLRSYHDEKFRMYQGKIDYGPIASQRHQYWSLTICTKAFAFDPFVASPELQQYYQNLPEVKLNRDETEGCKARYLTATSARDPFGNLPPEILTMILVQLPLQSIGQLRLASAVIVDLQLSGSFWKKKSSSSTCPGFGISRIKPSSDLPRDQIGCRSTMTFNLEVRAMERDPSSVWPTAAESGESVSRLNLSLHSSRWKETWLTERRSGSRRNEDGR